MLSRRDWSLAFTWAIVLHLAVLGVALWHWQPSTPLPPAPPKAPFVVKLAPLAKTHSQSQELQSTQALSANTPPQAKVEAITSSDIGLVHEGKIAAAKKLAQTTPPEPKQTLQPEPDPQPSAEPEQVAAVEPHKPAPQPQLEKPELIATKPAQQQSVASQAKSIQAETVATQNQAQQQGQDEILTLQMTQNWQAELIAHLAKKKRYPKMARKRRQEATVTVRFTIDAQGQARDIEVVQASRYPLLNKEAKSVVKRAQPLPLPPEKMLNNKVLVPVRFYLL
ncbi:energy transducer TonB [Pseudoalteromonas luteoviolacea]|uniref:energy transducer TonB n=1 Tax=Pseudoalteromonas luteoviolacea TaxID=43657 RepID=UPI001B358D45|nr:energy transducer TonB [Pseudoalteromonas luteoviolacea]